MADANTLLFRQEFNGKRLFKSQLDLVQELLQLPAYYVNPADILEYERAKSRLKAYVSQLLSPGTSRTVNEEFKNALSLLLGKKILEPILKREVLEAIIQDLEAKNRSTVTKVSRTESRHAATLMQDLYTASYVTVITSKPLDIDQDSDPEEQALRNFIFSDLIANLTNRFSKSKSYRFNFPLESYCELFWNGLYKMLYHWLDKLLDRSEFEMISVVYSEKFGVKSPIYGLYEKYKTIRFNDVPNDDLKEIRRQLLFTLTANIIEQLNINKVIVVYHVMEPIYTVPTIALNPDLLGGAKLYLMIEEDGRSMRISKMLHENAMLWRLFVWDKLKTGRNSRAIAPPNMQYS